MALYLPVLFAVITDLIEHRSPRRLGPTAEAAIVLALAPDVVAMVFSASYPRGLGGFKVPCYFILRQLAWLGIGSGALFVAARVPYPFWTRWSIPLIGSALLS